MKWVKISDQIPEKKEGHYIVIVNGDEPNNIALCYIYTSFEPDDNNEYKDHYICSLHFPHSSEDDGFYFDELINKILYWCKIENPKE